MTGANAKQVGGSHYKTGGMQPWDAVVGLKLDFFQGSILKYICRRKGESRVEDLLKAQHYIEKYIEVVREAEDDARRASESEDQARAGEPERVLVLPRTERDGRPSA